MPLERRAIYDARKPMLPYITFAFLVLMQIISVVWNAATMSATLDNVNKLILVAQAESREQKNFYITLSNQVANHEGRLSGLEHLR